MKVSLSTLIGLLLIGGALAIHFLKPEKPASVPHADVPSLHSFARIYNRSELTGLRSKTNFEGPETSFQKAKKLVLASKEKPPTERRNDLMQALTFLHDIEAAAPDWEQNLIQMRSEQTVIAILDLQGNF